MTDRQRQASGDAGDVPDVRKRRLRRMVLAAVAATLVTVAGTCAYDDVRGLSLVIRRADVRGLARRLAETQTTTYVERLVSVPLAGGTVAARAYVPDGASNQTALLVSGLHPAGIDEPRLVALSRELAKSRVTVVTPQIPELSRYEITAALTDHIEQAAVWLAANAELSPSGRIGLMGISFSGGLSIVAAGRPALRDRLEYVFAFGGHDDLPRVLTYLCTGVEGGPAVGPLPDLDSASVLGPPHDYGVAVVLLNVADHLVPSEQVDPLRDAVQRFLWASYLHGVDAPAAERQFAALRALAPSLPEPAATLLALVNDRDVARLGPRLLPYVASHVEAAALSPARSPAPTAPVFLLHGRHDTVIPAAESAYLAERLRAQSLPARLLLTDLISHVDADQPAQAIDVWRLARFWGDLLGR
jgi:dienelactone hydrolase